MWLVKAEVKVWGTGNGGEIEGGCTGESGSENGSGLEIYLLSIGMLSLMDA